MGYVLGSKIKRKKSARETGGVDEYQGDVKTDHGVEGGGQM